MALRIPSSRSDTMPRQPSSFSIATPMAIPNAREPAPPPLPPPRHLPGLRNGDDPGWRFGNDPEIRIPSLPPGSSLLGGSPLSSFTKRDPIPRKRSYLCSTAGDFHVDQMNSDSGDWTNSMTHDRRLRSERHLGQQEVQTSSQAYDKKQLSKFDNLNMLTKSIGPKLQPNSLPESTSSTRNVINDTHSQSVPERFYNHPESMISRPAPSAFSPGLVEFRSPSYGPSLTDSNIFRGYDNVSTFGGDDVTSRRSFCDQRLFDQDFVAEERRMRNLNINDRSPSGSKGYQINSKGPLKRRACSPLDETLREDKIDDISWRSQQLSGSRNSRFYPSHASVSSTSSYGQRNSYASSYDLQNSSSATSYSASIISPRAKSPVTEVDFGSLSSYQVSGSLDQTSRGSVQISQHQCGPSDKEPSPGTKPPLENITSSRKNSSLKISGLYICECCPKKPKKFDSEEELRVHELEKQHTCQYCPNRFKNKNEADRHQKSLHVRSHWWSCAALSGIEAAIQPMSSHPSSPSVCGYCGEKFTNPSNWEIRKDHLNNVHKFRECNQAKKFFRADHFRQHLKHSHAGIPGKWTNMLENACMKEEAEHGQSSRLGSEGSLGKSSILDESQDEC